MRLTGIRFGFATNSSSYHSILLAQNGRNVKNMDCTEGYYGWDHFMLTDKKAKADYMAAQLAHNGIEPRTVIDKKYAPAPLKDQPIIDHASVLDFPSYQGYKNFIRDYVSFIIEEDDIVIGGGNDNEENTVCQMGLLGKEIGINPRTKIIGNEADGWVMFDIGSGTKIRFGSSHIGKSINPELVDIKITDYCDRGCPFCYQDSTPDGKHAKLDDIKKIAGILGELQCFEVAIGGGEPTKHPDFAGIVEIFRGQDIASNFSTGTLDWVVDIDPEKLSRGIIGALGVSAMSPMDVRKIVGARLALPSFDTYIHYVAGSTPINVLENMVEELSGTPETVLVVLGYKNVGRGKNFKPYNYDALPGVLVKAITQHGLSVSVDTTIISQFKNSLESLGFDKRTFADDEGKFSMYIDAVNHLWGPSSYDHKNLEFFDINKLTPEALTQIFSKW